MPVFIVRGVSRTCRRGVKGLMIERRPVSGSNEGPVDGGSRGERVVLNNINALRGKRRAEIYVRAEIYGHAGCGVAEK